MTRGDLPVSGRDDELARRLGQAREELDLREGRGLRGAVDEAHRWIEAAALAGIAIAVLDDDTHGTGTAGADRSATTAATSSAPAPPARVTATVRGTDNRPLERDVYAAYLQVQVDHGRLGQRRRLLTDSEAEAVAALLDELSGVYAGEDLGQLARELAVQINDRLGI